MLQCVIASLFADSIYRLNSLQLGCNCRYALCVVIGVTAPRLLM